MVQKIKRKIEVKENEIYKMKTIGYNSNKVLTLVCTDKDEQEVIFNINDSDLRKLKEFIRNL